MLSVLGIGVSQAELYRDLDSDSGSANPLAHYINSLNFTSHVEK